MKKSTKVKIREWVKKSWGYAALTILTLFIVIFGTIDKVNSGQAVGLDLFGNSAVEVSVDQISELYVVAETSDTLGLASASSVAGNYVMAATMYEAGQSTSGKLEKPNLTDIGVSRGVVEYTVSEGETMEEIAADFGVSTDDIRWSNGLKTTEVSAGTTLYIPSVSGIVYTVQAGDTAESLAEKYGGTAEEIIALNDLENSGLTEGARILIKDGTLPETERPEYVAPVKTYTYTYSYLGNTSERVNLTCNYSLGAGQCTTWALLKRPDLSSYALTLGNANNWAYAASNLGYTVNRTPSAGAIFQTSSGWYGHVGYVESVNADGSINVSERNYSGCYGVLYSTIPASAVGNFNYIH